MVTLRFEKSWPSTTRKPASSLTISIHMGNHQTDGTGSDQKNDGRQLTEEGVGEGGGLGEGPKVLLPIGDTIGRNIEVPTTLTFDFCAQYKLGDEIFKQLDAVELDNVGALIRSKNLASEEYHLKLGHIAEVKWALKVMLLSCPGIEEVKIPPGYYKPTVIGGRGGDGGAGGKQGGEGGMGKSPRITLEDLHRFGSIRGGSGGAGGVAGVQVGINSESQNPNGQEGALPQDATQTGASIEGGQGGDGGFGVRVGGKGGVGGAPVLPLEAIGLFQCIKGGHGGTGGAALEKGGKGGTGECPKFPKPLVVIDQAARLRVHENNMTLKEDGQMNAKLKELGIIERLFTHLDQQGFQTVGGLFELYDTDFDGKRLAAGDKDVLKCALEKFLEGVNKKEQ